MKAKMLCLTGAGLSHLNRSVSFLPFKTSCPFYHGLTKTITSANTTSIIRSQRNLFANLVLSVDQIQTSLGEKNSEATEIIYDRAWAIPIVPSSVTTSGTGLYRTKK